MFPTPKNFSWLLEGLLAGLARPTSRGDIQYLIRHGIKHIVSLTETPLSSSIDLDGLDVTFTQIPVDDLTAPSIQQVKEFISLVEFHIDKNQAVAVHCQFGKGRVGTMLACYLVDKKNLSANDAIHAVRTKRPGSIETKSQEKLIAKFSELSKQTRS